MRAVAFLAGLCCTASVMGHAYAGGFTTTYVAPAPRMATAPMPRAVPPTRLYAAPGFQGAPTQGNIHGGAPSYGMPITQPPTFSRRFDSSAQPNGRAPRSPSLSNPFKAQGDTHAVGLENSVGGPLPPNPGRLQFVPVNPAVPQGSPAAFGAAAGHPNGLQITAAPEGEGLGRSASVQSPLPLTSQTKTFAGTVSSSESENNKGQESGGLTSSNGTYSTTNYTLPYSTNPTPPANGGSATQGQSGLTVSNGSYSATTSAPPYSAGGSPPTHSVPLNIAPSYQAPQPIYTFSQTSSGTVQVFQNGQLISTTTVQNAATTYGYGGSSYGSGVSQPVQTYALPPVQAPASPIGSSAQGPTYAPGEHAIIPASPQIAAAANNSSPSATNPSYFTTPSGAVVNGATGQLVTPPPVNWSAPNANASGPTNILPMAIQPRSSASNKVTSIPLSALPPTGLYPGQVEPGAQPSQLLGKPASISGAFPPSGSSGIANTTPMVVTHPSGFRSSGAPQYVPISQMSPSNYSGPIPNATMAQNCLATVYTMIERAATNNNSLPINSFYNSAGYAVRPTNLIPGTQYNNLTNLPVGSQTLIISGTAITSAGGSEPHFMLGTSVSQVGSTKLISAIDPYSGVSVTINAATGQVIHPPSGYAQIDFQGTSAQVFQIN